jgi:hypothetical protein
MHQTRLTASSVRQARKEREALVIRTMLRDPSRLLLLVVLAVLLASCGGDALRQCEETVSGLEEQNEALQDALAESQAEGQQLQEALADAQAGAGQVREELSQGEVDLSWLRERLWALFHDGTPAIWACDDTASQVVPVEEMPSVSPEEMVAALDERFQALNPVLESPGLVLEGMEGDTAVVSLEQSTVVTEQMGSTGAQCYFAGVTFSLTSLDGIDHVRFELEEGSHGGPGRYDRTDFVWFLPLEPAQP